MVCKATNLTQSPIFWGFYKIAEKLINLLNLVWVWLICAFCCCDFAFLLLRFGVCFVFLALLAVDVLSVTLANLGDLANFSNVTN